jgi:hypothetical protein
MSKPSDVFAGANPPSTVTPSLCDLTELRRNTLRMRAIVCSTVRIKTRIEAHKNQQSIKCNHMAAMPASTAQRKFCWCKYSTLATNNAACSSVCRQHVASSVTSLLPLIHVSLYMKILHWQSNTDIFASGGTRHTASGSSTLMQAQAISLTWNVILETMCSTHKRGTARLWRQMTLAKRQDRAKQPDTPRPRCSNECLHVKLSAEPR